MHRCFGFAIQRYNFPTSRKCKISIFPLHCPSRNAISSKVFNEFSKTFFWLKDEERGYLFLKFQVHRYFCFAIATLPLFQHPENVKFQFFPLHCPSRNAISSKVFNDFSKTLLLDRGMRNVAIVVENFNSTEILVFAIATLQIFQHPENVKISISPSHCPSRNAISSKVFNEFSKTFFWAEKMRKVAILFENFKCHRYF